MKKTLSILFIGNSHTFYNDMPFLVRRRAEEEGFDCRAVMLAHGAWFLAQHAGEPEVRFNILYGNFDYVVLQEYDQPFGPVGKFLDAAVALSDLIRRGGSVPVIYETWARKDEPEKQPFMNETHRMIAARIGALLAPVGEVWWEYQKSRPSAELYADDGGHASPAGSDLAAKVLWETIRSNITADPPRTASDG